MTGMRGARLIRVSGDSQDERSQIRDCDIAAQREGVTIIREDFQLHAVSGYKGAKKHTDALEAVLAAIRAGELDCIIVAHSSRLTRRDPDEADLFALQVRMSGGRIISHDEQAYGAGDLMSKFTALMAHEENNKYSRDLSGHVNRKFRNEIDPNGGFRGSVPDGYMIVGEKYRKRLVPDVAGVRKHSAEEIANAIRDAASGTSTVRLGKRLGIGADAVSHIIRNPVYSTGRYVIVSHRECPANAECRKGGERTPDSQCVTVQHRTEPLDGLTPDEQAAAIAALDARRTYDKPSSREISHEDLSGAVFCVCGHHIGMHRHFSGKVRQRRYRCRECGRTVHADKTDAAVNDLMLSRTDMAWLDKWLIPGDDHSAELERVKLEYRELSSRGLDFDAEDIERDRLRAEIKRLESLPSTPARWAFGQRRDETGQALNQADKWRELDNAGRRAWLTSGEFRITVSRPSYGGVLAELEYVPDETGDPY